MRLLLLLILTVVLSACGNGESDTGSSGGPSSESTNAGASTGVEVAGLRFVPAPQWQDLGASAMRKAQYRQAPVSGDTEPAELYVFHFGPDQGGSIEANIQRWLGQMSLPGGADPTGTADRSQFQVDGMPVHALSVAGTFAMPVGAPMARQTEPREGYRLIAAIVEGPEGPVFFKLTGPDATATAMGKQLDTLVRGVRKAR